MLKTISIIFCVLSIQMNAQQNAQLSEWTLSGNNVSGDSKLGTNNGFDLIFETANIERMRITDGGWIGIGVANPDAFFHIGGSFKLDGTL